MVAKARFRGTLRTPWRRRPERRKPTPIVAEGPTGSAKDSLREGGLQPDAKDPLRHAPLKEPYGARSGAHPAPADTPAAVAQARQKRKRRSQGPR
ncbi:hypothetical protein FRZ61_19090 [Hypericibacter adhaerens]|uniref:Uncharacterized protein n=1 Tax=Hypericibacter adhaerens TaxID=2602016 RepID=A0A5J6N061_9PROT|nr:hypothetical protein FRZ61_19090 [Hypericibacter adhaerens]